MSEIKDAGGYLVPQPLMERIMNPGAPVPEEEPIDRSHEMAGVREYGDELPVELMQNVNGKQTDRWILQASNEGGCCATYVDLFDLLNWLKENRPDLLEQCGLEEQDEGEALSVLRANIQRGNHDIIKTDRSALGWANT